MEECTRGLEVRRFWSEKEMTCTFGGHMFPGTPDGMFETWDGNLICVQVVRVPLVLNMNSEKMNETLKQTILNKILKSQQWLRACHVMPHDFVIFCWLPFSIPSVVENETNSLMQRVNALDPRFSLSLCVPAEPHKLFPDLFAYSNPNKLYTHSRTISENDVSTFSGVDDENDEEDIPTWDITWGWDLDLSCAEGGDAGDQVEEEREADKFTPSECDEEVKVMKLKGDNFECGLDITEGWQRDWTSPPKQRCDEINLDHRGKKGENDKNQHESVDTRAQIRLLWDDGG